MKYLVIVPARGGSKGVPRKNIIDVNGRPLIAYTLDVAIKLKTMGIIDTVMVSTDDVEIADISTRLGASVPFIRSEELARDNSKSVDVIIDVLNYYRKSNIEFEAVMLLQPTTPLRSVSDLQDAIKIYESSQSESLISCYKEEYICDKVMYSKSKNLAIPKSNDHNSGSRRQDNDDVYVRNGSIYITSVDYLLKQRKVISDVPALYVMDEMKSVNVDTYSDLEYLRWIITR